MAESNSNFFGGLKKWIFKDAPSSATPPDLPPAADKESNPSPEVSPSGQVSSVATTADNSGDADSIARKAFEMLESINKPGIDFMEVWNAAEENGGVSAANLKMAFNTLKFADKNLTKDQVIQSGNYYKNALQKALDEDIVKKQQELQKLNQEKQLMRSSLSATVEDTKKKIAELQQLLTEKSNELHQLDNNFEPKLKALDQRIVMGREAIGNVIHKISNTISIIQQDL